VAEELGTAVLRITVDDTELRAQLRKAETLTRQTSQRLQSSATGGSFGQLDLAYKNALKTSEQLLQTDLKRLQVARQFTQALSRAQTTRTASETSGFASFSQGIGGSAVDRSIRRNAERRAQVENRRTAQLDALDADLARVRQQRVALEKGALAGIRAQQLRRKRGQDIASNALIGGAFPLLFGQGAGAAIGGAGGGAAGGAIGGQFGFGLSLIGTAVGAQFDAIVAKALTLGRALDDPIASFGALQESALLSSKGLERQIQGLIAVGREAEAAALIQQDLANSYGGLEAARRLADEQDRLGRSWAQFSVALGQVALGPIADSAQDAAIVLTRLADVLDRISKVTPPAILRIAAGGVRAASSAITPVSSLVTGVADFVRSRRGAPQTESTAAPPEVTASEDLRKQLLSEQYRLIDAQVQGYKDLVLQREKEISLTREAIDLENLRAKKATEPELEDRRNQGSQERYKIDQQIAQLDKQRTADVEKRTRQEQAAQLISSTNSALQSQAIERQIAAAQELGSVEVGAARDALSLRQQVTEQISAAQDRVVQLGGEISAARIEGDEPRARALIAEQQNAAGQVELAIVRGATALNDASKELRSAGADLRIEAVTIGKNLQSLRVANFQFLSPAEQRRAFETAKAAAGVSNLKFAGTGTLEERTRNLQRVGDFRSQERQLIEQADKAAQAFTLGTQPLVASNSELGSNILKLQTVVDNLVSKNWNVAVNVQGASGAQIVGDVVGAL
jgi:hypothetical protein